MLLRADRVWDGIGPSAIDVGFVAVDDGAVVAIGRQADLGSRFSAMAEVDLPGATVLPGLINAHVHLTFSASRTPVEDYLVEADAGIATLTLRAVSNLQGGARVGVTTVRDLGTLNEVAFAARAAAADGRIVASRVVTSGQPITATGGHCHWFSHQCDTSEEIRAAVRTQVEAGSDLIKIFATGGNLTPGTDPFVPQYSLEEVAACVDEAKRLGQQVAAHAHAPEGIRRSVAAGASTIEHCFFETPDSVEFDARVAETMAARQIAFCPTLGAGVKQLLTLPLEELNPVQRRLRGKVPLFVDVWRRLVAAGAPVLAGSDAGIPFRPFSDYPADVGMMANADFIGLTPTQALTAATSNAAAILGLDDTGTLEAGKRADILAVDGDPLKDIDDLTRTKLVMIGGRCVPLADVS